MSETEKGLLCAIFFFTENPKNCVCDENNISVAILKSSLLFFSFAKWFDLMKGHLRFVCGKESSSKSTCLDVTSV